MSDEHETTLKMFNDNEEKEILSLISTDTTNAISTHSTIDESFYEVPGNDDSLTSVVHTTK
jgi:hypothetical protein